ncbi:TetR/AcrR family transcriptional regulator [Micavibrio aeruginosavorus]|uniref:TetR/AcrR family transcriptional regulator n=1 Tax=Micavibrio aeruginosavorus TaxID=349221 RepID=UPI003F4AA022
MSHAATDTRQKLIDTAGRLIWMNSYGAVSVDDICKTADVKKGSFYHFFPSKADLAMAALDSEEAILRPIYDTIFSASRPPVERLTMLADLIVEKQAEMLREVGHVCGCPSGSLGCELAGTDSIIKDKIEQIFAFKKRYYEATIRDLMNEGLLPQDTDCKARADEILDYITGQMLVARVQNSLDHLERNLRSGLLRLLGLKDPDHAVDAA